MNDVIKVKWQANWIWKKELLHRKNTYIYTRKVFNVPKGLEEKIVYITASSSYKLYVNGRYIGQGPVQTDPHQQYFDSYDITRKVNPGKNVIAVLVYFEGNNVSLGINTRGGLLCQVNGYKYDAPRAICVSNQSWKIQVARAWKQDSSVFGNNLGFVEEFDANKVPEWWSELEFNDTQWGNPDLVDKPRTLPWTELVPRDIPMLSEVKLYPQEMAGAGEVWQRRVSEYLLKSDPAGLMASDINMRLKYIHINDKEILTGKKPGVMTIHAEQVNGTDINGYIILDFGKQINGYLNFKVEGRKNSIIDVGYSDFLWNGQIDPLYNGRTADRYILKEGVQEWTSYHWRSFRYVQLSIRNFSNKIKLHSLAALFVSYPLELKGSFQCSDSELNRIWEQSVYTTQLCMMDQYMDSPVKGQKQGIREGRVSALVNYSAFGDYQLSKKMLKQLVQSRMPDGCLRSYWPCCSDKEEEKVQDIDGPLMFIPALYEYYYYSGNRDFLKKMYPFAKEQINWFEKYLDKDGLLSDTPCSIMIDNRDIDRRGKNAVINCWYYWNLQLVVKLAEDIYENSDAGDWREIARKLKAGFNETFWNSRSGVYADSIYQDELSDVISEHSNALPFLYNLAKPEMLKKVIRNLYHSNKKVESISPLFINYLGEAWCRSGQVKLFLNLLKKRFGFYQFLEGSTLGNSWTADVPHLVCHAEAAGSAYIFSKYILGISPFKPGFDEFFVMPRTGYLDSAKGVFPSIKGDISVSWEKKKNEFILKVQVPGNTIGHIGIQRIHLLKEIVRCNGKIIWRKKKKVSDHRRISRITLKKQFVIFKVKPGKYIFNCK